MTDENPKPNAFIESTRELAQIATVPIGCEREIRVTLSERKENGRGAFVLIEERLAGRYLRGVSLGRRAVSYVIDALVRARDVLDGMRREESVNAPRDRRTGPWGSFEPPKPQGGDR